MYFYVLLENISENMDLDLTSVLENNVEDDWIRDHSQRDKSAYLKP